MKIPTIGKIHLYFIVTLLLMLFSCSREEDYIEDILSEAEKTLDDQPHKVSIQLDSLQKTELNEYEVNRVKLLRARLQWKEDSLPQTDSIISKLLHYFTERNDQERIMMSAFIKAVINRRCGNYKEAVELFCDALDIAVEREDPFWKGRIHDQLFGLFFDRGSYYLAYNTALAACKDYLEANDTLRSKFSSVDAALSAHGLTHLDRNIAMIDSLLSLPRGTTVYDTTFVEYALQVQLQPLVESKLYDKADSVIRMLKHNPYYKALPEYLSEEAILRAKQNRLGEAKLLSDSSLGISKNQIGKMYAFDALAEHALASENYKMYVNYKDSTRLYSGLVNRDRKNSGVDLAYELHSKNKALALQQESNHKSRVIFSIVIIICLLCVIAGGTIIFLQIRKMRLQKRVISLIGEIEQAKMLNIEYKSQTNEFVRHNAENVNNILEMYNSGHAQGKRPQKSITEIQKSLDKIITNIDMDELEKFVNYTQENIATNIRSEIPDLTDDQFKLFILTLIGWKSQTIAIYCETTRNNIYQRRKRLISMIEESNAPHKNDFLEALKTQKT